MFNTCEKPYLYNVYKFVLLENSDILSIVKQYSKDPNVVYAEPNYIYKTCVIPNDPDFNLQYYLNNTGQTGGKPDADIDAPEAWEIETGNEDIVICIHDTGLEMNRSADGIGGPILNNPVRHIFTQCKATITFSEPKKTIQH